MTVTVTLTLSRFFTRPNRLRSGVYHKNIALYPSLETVPDSDGGVVVELDVVK